MKIAIRADGGYIIGMGHIMRTLVLAKELSKNHEVFYVCRVEEEYLKGFESNICSKYIKGVEKISSEGFRVEYVRENNLLEDLRNINADILITDSYDVDEEYFNETKKVFSKTAYIDDMNLHYFNVDFLINPNLDGMDFKYKVNDTTKMLVGPKYIMLRDEFRNAPEKYIKEKLQDIMITVGGADPNHVTEQILSYVKLLKYNFHVIVGPSFDEDNSIKSFESNRIILYHNANMYELMQKCDAAISACGSTLYEFAACGLPTLGIIVADNQQSIAEKMNELGMIKNIGWHNKLSKDIFVTALKNLCNDFSTRKEMSQIAKKAIDGKGVNRLVEGLEL